MRATNQAQISFLGISLFLEQLSGTASASDFQTLKGNQVLRSCVRLNSGMHVKFLII
jgi:hypothetical protein